jgi:hypothetical protein
VCTCVCVFLCTHINEPHPHPPTYKHTHVSQAAVATAQGAWNGGTSKGSSSTPGKKPLLRVQVPNPTPVKLLHPTPTPHHVTFPPPTTPSSEKRNTTEHDGATRPSVEGAEAGPTEGGMIGGSKGFLSNISLGTQPKIVGSKWVFAAGVANEYSANAGILLLLLLFLLLLLSVCLMCC